MDETRFNENIPSGLVFTSLMLSGLGNDGLGSPLSVTITITATKGGMYKYSWWVVAHTISWEFVQSFVPDRKTSALQEVL